MPVTRGGYQTLAGNPGIISRELAAVAVGAVAAILAAVTDNANYRKFYNSTTLWTSPDGTAKKITATAGGTEADIKAIAVTVIGTDSADAPLTEALPVFTVNTAGSVTSVGSFKTVTEIRIPVHDGTGATTSLSYEGGAVGAVLAAWTDKGAGTYHKTGTFTNPAVPRNVIATAGGTAGDIKAIIPIVFGLNEDGVAISESLPVFTVDTAGSVVGSKAFASITSVEIPPHDNTGATTSFGTGAKLGIGHMISRDTVVAAYLAGVREATRPTVVFSSSALEGNLFTLSSTLNGTAVILDYIRD